MPGGELDLGGASTLQTFSQFGGLLSGSGTVSVLGLASLSSGARSGFGTTVAEAGIALTSTAFGLDGGRVLELQGTSTVTGTNVQMDLNRGNDIGSGTLRVDAGTLFDDQSTWYTSPDRATRFRFTRKGARLSHDASQRGSNLRRDVLVPNKVTQYRAS